ncbi:MAG: molybdopterin-synthase adenylyltransferase MoeB [Bacteroidota bacterium]
MTFTTAEQQLYARHFTLPEFGVEGQKRLKRARVLVVGAGGLGSPVLLYLAAAGVGHIGIVDDDVVDVTNLQRQVLYTHEDIGTLKVDAAKRRLQALNPHIQITTHAERLTVDNALRIIQQYDIVADGTDNFTTRYLVNDACVLADKVNVYASIFRFEGQVSVFNLLRADGSRGPHYRDLFSEPPATGTVPSCAEGGVLGVLPGIIGSLQANEVIKVAAQVGEPLDGRLFLFDAASFTSRVLKIATTSSVKVERLEAINEIYCEVTSIPTISVDEFKQLQSEDADFQLIDVREEYEYEAQNIGGLNMPLSELEQHIEQISREKQVVVHCKSGARSQQAVQMMREQFGLNNTYSLEGGLLAAVAN